MASHLKWDGEKCTAVIRAEMKRRIAACCIVVFNHAKKLLNVEGTGTSGTGKSSRLVYGANPSAPGEPPHKQRGRLIGSLAFEISELLGRVGTNYKVGRWLELGTKRVAARPWLRRALLECRQIIRAILSRPMP